MKVFIEYVVKALVDYPEQVDIREVDGDRVVVFEVRLNPTDIGKVIGKSGRTITAIRTLLSRKAAGNGHRLPMCPVTRRRRAIQGWNLTS